MRDIAAIVETAHEQALAAVRARYGELRLLDATAAKSEDRALVARTVADRDKEAARRKRIELGKALIEARKAWPERGPQAKGWGEFLAREGIPLRTAHDYIRLASERISAAAEILHPGELEIVSGKQTSYAVHGAVKNLDHAIGEMQAARDELAAVPPGAYRYQREKALVEPMARLRLVVRYLEEVIEENEA